MVAVANNFEGGTASATLTTANAGGAGNNQLDAVTGTPTFDTTHARGSLSLKLDTTATPADCGGEWSTAVGTLTTWYQRMYYYATSHPVNQHRILDSATAGGAALCSGIYHQAAGTFGVADGGFNIALQGAVQIPLNQWVRVEIKTIGSATVGQIAYKMFLGDAPNPLEFLTSSPTTNTSGSAVFYRFGFHGDTYDPSRIVGVDDFGVSSTTWLGPSRLPPAIQTRPGRSEALQRSYWW